MESWRDVRLRLLEGGRESGALPKGARMEQVPQEEEDRESKTTHFVSSVGPVSTSISSSSSFPVSSLLRPLSIWSLPFTRCYGPMQISGGRAFRRREQQGQRP